jgi:hypothetical protein
VRTQPASLVYTGPMTGQVSKVQLLTLAVSYPPIVRPELTPAGSDLTRLIRMLSGQHDMGKLWRAFTVAPPQSKELVRRWYSLGHELDRDAATICGLIPELGRFTRVTDDLLTRVWGDTPEPTSGSALSSRSRGLDIERYTRAPIGLERKVFGDAAPDRLLAVDAIRTRRDVAAERPPSTGRVWSVRNLGARSIRLLFRKIEKYLRRILGIAHTSPVFRVEDERDTSRVDHSHESHRSRAPGRSRTSVDLVLWEPALT